MSNSTKPTDSQISKACQDILNKNWTGQYTMPADKLYPHQWLWDSCFAAIGWRHISIPRAQQEIRSLLRGQWSNGMLPHMIFDNKHHNFTKDSNIWQSKRNPYAPDDVATSGITQPPMLAEAVVQIGQKISQLERRSWYQDIYPALVKYHQWLYQERDPHQCGLIVLLHPWESGLDNSPPWIEQLHNQAKPWWIKLIERLKLDYLASFFRRDTHYVPPGQRLNNLDALLYHAIMLRLRRKNWDSAQIMQRSHFMVEDLAFNCVLVRANQHLLDIAKVIAHQLPEDLLENIQRTEENLEKLWDAYYSQYFSRNFISQKSLKQPTIATLLPLYAGSVTPERASELVELLHNKQVFGTKYPVPSVPKNSKYFNQHRYWQGPTWVNTNWLIIDGLKRYGFNKEAENLRQQTIQMVGENGCFEYFSPLDGSPAGAENFSWTAALTIDLINQK